MSEKVNFGVSQFTTRNSSAVKAVVRTPVLRFEIIRWDWTKGTAKDKKPIDITPAVFSFRWLKSLRNPDSGCEITMIPQFSDVHYLDSLDTMDVVRIYEFNTLKYLGFIRRIGASGSISPTGVPSRTVNITCSSFGALFSESELGLNMLLHSGIQSDISARIKTFAGKLSDVALLDKPYSELIKLVIEEWFSFLDANKATTYKNYFNEFIDYESGLVGKTIPGFPKEFYLFYSHQQTMTLWDMVSKLVQLPFNEVWFDCGPRNLWVENNENLSPAKPGEVKLLNEKEHLIIRVPPFNGTVVNNTTVDLWDSLPSRIIPLSYLTRFDLNKSMDESMSFYLVAPPAYNPGELALVVQGEALIDSAAFNKYLYKPMIFDTTLIRIQKSGESGMESKANEIYKDIKDKVNTLKNWNQYNDKYLSGSFTFMVPSEEIFDPRIGDKIEIENLNGMYFYVEGVSHSWNYGGPLISNVSVTRGWSDNGPILLKDKIFKRGKFTMGSKFV